MRRCSLTTWLALVCGCFAFCSALAYAQSRQDALPRTARDFVELRAFRENQLANPPADLPDEVTIRGMIHEVIGKHTLGQFWGSVGVLYKDKVVTCGFGLADESLRPIDGDSILDTGSISKQFTAAAILKLQEQGKLSIDDPVSKFFPKAGGRAEKVTLKHLLTHTSGMNGENSIMNLDYPDRDKAVRRAMNAMRDTEPGEESEFEYANAGYVVLGAVIEVASGQEFGAYIREQIFKPAGLTSTGFLDGVGLDLSHATLRVVDEGHGRPQRRTLLQDGWGWGFKGCGGVLSTANDMLRWHAALNGETVLSKDSKHALFTVAKDNYALGWFVDSTAGGAKRQWHSGGTRGYVAWFARYPQQNAAIVVLTNAQFSAPEIGEKIQRLVLSEAPEVGSTIDTREFKESERPLLNHEEGLDVVVRTDKKLVLIDVVRATADGAAQGKPLATLVLRAAAAKKVAADVREFATREGDKPRVGGFVGFKPYTVADGVATLPETLQVRVQPKYRGYNSETGKQTIDDRVMIVAMDDDNGFWPVIIKMDHTTAKRVADAIDAASNANE